MFLLKRRNSKLALEKLLLPLLLLLLLILAYYNIIFLENARPGKILQKTLENMEQNYDSLQLEICERGQGYRINFKGNIKDKNVFYGNISDYKLDIYKHSSGELFIKDLKDGTWKSAVELELDSLQDFLVSPLEILALWSHLFKKAKFVDYTAGEEKVVLLTISPQELENTAFLYDYLQQRPLSLECLIFIEPEKFFITHIVLSLYDQENRANILSRTFSISPSANAFPSFPDTISSSILGKK